MLYFGLIQIEYKYKRLLAPRCCTGRPYFQPIHRVLPLPNRRSKWANHLIRLVETCLFQLVLELKCLFLFVSNKKCELYHCVTQFVKRVIRQNPTKLWRITKSVKIGRNKNFDELLTFLTNDRTTVISSNFDKLLFWRMANHPNQKHTTVPVLLFTNNLFLLFYQIHFAGKTGWSRSRTQLWYLWNYAKYRTNDWSIRSRQSKKEEAIALS